MCEVRYGVLDYSECGHSEMRVLSDIKQCATAIAQQQDCDTVEPKVIVERKIKSRCFVYVGLQ